MASAAAEESPLETAQRLVRTVARAFYSDELVVMLDMLLRDRYLRDSTMDKRVGISAKLARRLLTELIGEHLIKTEEIQDESGTKEPYYYLDFNHFTNVIRYRTHLMQKELERLEKEANENQMYLCTSCNKRMPMLQVQSLRNKRYGFCCPTCCQQVSHRDCDNERFEMKPGGSEASYEQVQELREKLKKQMAAQDDLVAPHDGIFNLLKALEGKTLPSMLPSELMAVGVTADGTEEGGRRGRGGGGGSGGGKGERGQASGSIFEQLAVGTRNGGYMEEDDEEGGADTKPAQPPIRMMKETPEFLIGSRVIQEDQQHAPQPQLSAQAVAPVKEEDRGPRVMTEEERKEAYRKALEAELERQLREAPASQQTAVAGSGIKKEEDDGEPGTVVVEHEEEEEDMEWEEAED